MPLPHYDIYHPKKDKKDSAYPFSAPGNDKHSNYNISWNKMHKQRQYRLKEPRAFSENVKGKHTQKEHEKHTDNPGCPEE
jgi:hypothetical protein